MRTAQEALVGDRVAKDSFCGAPCAMSGQGGDAADGASVHLSALPPSLAAGAARAARVAVESAAPDATGRIPTQKSADRADDGVGLAATLLAVRLGRGQCDALPDAATVATDAGHAAAGAAMLGAAGDRGEASEACQPSALGLRLASSSHLPVILVDAASALRSRGVLPASLPPPSAFTLVRCGDDDSAALSDAVGIGHGNGVDAGDMADNGGRGADDFDRGNDAHGCTQAYCVVGLGDSPLRLLPPVGSVAENIGPLLLPLGAAAVVTGGGWTLVSAEGDGEGTALVLSRFDGDRALPGSTDAAGSDTSSAKRDARKREARKQKKAAKKAHAAAAAAAAAAASAGQALVPKGFFKSVPIPWDADTLADARRAADPRATPAVEREHVRDLYDAVAEQWHSTRWKAWPRVTEFVSALPRGSLVVDVGCGNGKNIPACDEVGAGVGCDISAGLAAICRRRGFEVAVADAMRLPYRTGAFDAALSIAVMHHLSTRARRVRALAELGRVVCLGGTALVYAWAFEQRGAKSGHQFGSQDVFVPWHTRETACSGGGDGDGDGGAGGAGGGGDAAAADDGKVLQRFCHVYKEGELESLAREVPWLAVVDGWYDTGNWAVVLRVAGAVPPDYEDRFDALASQMREG